MQKMKSVGLLLFVPFAAAISTCPTAAKYSNLICSGHGQCGKTKPSVCDCWSGWDFAADCSKRTCPSGTAWVDKATSTNTAHAKAECSNAGNCDRETGKCICQAGHTGDACQRTACECSGHGYCKSIKDLAYENAGITYTNWDADVIQMCNCDDGFTGPRCSQVMCPKADDPKTTGQADRVVRVTTGAGGTLSGTFTLVFGGREVTFNADGSKMGDCQDIIDQFDNIETATCALVGSVGSKKEVKFDITLKSYPILPRQNNIFFHDGYDVDASKFFCRTSSASPASATCTVSVTNAGANVKEYAYCANSGKCDFTTGLCSCFTGYAGAACETKQETSITTKSDPVYQLESQSNGYTGSVLSLRTFKGANTDFNFLNAAAGASASSAGTSVFSVRGDGQVSASGTVLANKGLTASGAQSSIANGLLLTGDLTMTDVKGVLHSKKDADGNNPLLDIKSTSTAYQSDVLRVQATRPTGTTNFNLLNLKGASKDFFTVRGDGQITADKISLATLAVSTKMTLDGSLDSTGDIAADTITLAATDKSKSAVSLQTTAADFASSALTVNVKRGLKTALDFKFLDVSAGDGLTKKNVFDIDGAGKVNIHQAGLAVDAGGVQVKAGGLSVVSGGATVAAGGLAVQDGGVQTQNSGGVALAVTGEGTLTSAKAGGASLHIKASKSDFKGQVLKLEHAVGSATTLDFIQGRDASAEIFAIDGEGTLETKGSLRASQGFGMQEVPAASKRPACNSASRGMFFVSEAGLGTDQVQVCVKFGGSMAWKTVTLT